jgi:hypothetical protein
MRVITRNATLGSNLSRDRRIADRLCEDDATVGRSELSWMRGKGKRSGEEWALFPRSNKLLSAGDSAPFRDAQAAVMFTITAATRRQIQFTLWT